jgi:hypothetical protein
MQDIRKSILEHEKSFKNSNKENDDSSVYGEEVNIERVKVAYSSNLSGSGLRQKLGKGQSSHRLQIGRQHLPSNFPRPLGNLDELEIQVFDFHRQREEQN